MSTLIRRTSSWFDGSQRKVLMKVANARLLTISGISVLRRRRPRARHVGSDARRSALDYCFAVQLTAPESQVSVTTPAASWSVSLICHLPDNFVRVELSAPLTLPSTSKVVPSSRRTVSGPNEALNFPFLLTRTSRYVSGTLAMLPEVHCR